TPRGYGLHRGIAPKFVFFPDGQHVGSSLLCSRPQHLGPRTTQGEGCVVRLDHPLIRVHTALYSQPAVLGSGAPYRHVVAYCWGIEEVTGTSASLSLKR